MKLESFRSIKQEDVKEEFRPLISVIGSVINNFATQVINAMTNNITVEDNLNREYKQLDVTVGSDGVPTTDTFFQLQKIKNIKITGVNVVRAENQTNVNTYPSGSPFVSFSQDNNFIRIKHVTGLQSSNKYKLTLEIHGK